MEGVSRDTQVQVEAEWEEDVDMQILEVLQQLLDLDVTHVKMWIGQNAMMQVEKQTREMIVHKMMNLDGLKVFDAKIRGIKVGTICIDLI